MMSRLDKLVEELMQSFYVDQISTNVYFQHTAEIIASRIIKLEFEIERLQSSMTVLNNKLEQELLKK